MAPFWQPCGELDLRLSCGRSRSRESRNSTRLRGRIVLRLVSLETVWNPATDQDTCVQVCFLPIFLPTPPGFSTLSAWFSINKNEESWCPKHPKVCDSLCSRCQRHWAPATTERLSRKGETFLCCPQPAGRQDEGWPCNIVKLCKGFFKDTFTVFHRMHNCSNDYIDPVVCQFLAFHPFYIWYAYWSWSTINTSVVFHMVHLGKRMIKAPNHRQQGAEPHLVWSTRHFHGSKTQSIKVSIGHWIRLRLRYMFHRVWF